MYKTDLNLVPLVFGATRTWWVRGVVLTLALVGVSLGSKKLMGILRTDFLTLFLGITLTFFTAISYFFDAPLYARLLLPWLIPALFWITRMISLPPKAVRVAVISTFGVLLVLLPLIQGPEIYEMIGNFTKLKELVGEATRGNKKLPSRCYEYSGDPDQTQWTKSFYLGMDSRRVLREEARTSVDAKCDHIVHIFISRNMNSGARLPFTVLPPQYHEIFHDEDGNRILVSSK